MLNLLKAITQLNTVVLFLKRWNWYRIFDRNSHTNFVYSRYILLRSFIKIVNYNNFFFYLNSHGMQIIHNFFFFFIWIPMGCKSFICFGMECYIWSHLVYGYKLCTFWNIFSVFISNYIIFFLFNINFNFVSKYPAPMFFVFTNDFPVLDSWFALIIL